jgi:hypothetical protein
MLSGVGPAEHLSLREVEVLLDQPAVGENLSDHAATQLVWTTPEPESLLLALEPAALEEYEASRTGPFASNLAEAGGFVRVDSDAPAPDVQFHLAPVHIVDDGMSDPEGHGVWVSPCLLTPHSRGSVRLASSDPTAKPIVRNDFYTAGDDMRRMIAGLRMTLDICGQPAMRPYCAEPFNTPGAHDVRRLPPGRDLPHGRGCRGGSRSAAAGQRPGEPARGRRLRHARRPARQHERADDRHRREGRGPDPPRASARRAAGGDRERRRISPARRRVVAGHVTAPNRLG